MQTTNQNEDQTMQLLILKHIFDRKFKILHFCTCKMTNKHIPYIMLNYNYLVLSSQDIIKIMWVLIKMQCLLAPPQIGPSQWTKQSLRRDMPKNLVYMQYYFLLSSLFLFFLDHGSMQEKRQLKSSITLFILYFMLHFSDEHINQMKDQPTPNFPYHFDWKKIV